MAKSSMRRRNVLLLPLVLLTVIVLEELAVYELRLRVRDPALRTVAVMGLLGVGFAVAADWVAPAIQRALAAVRSNSRRGGGWLGIWVFYAAAYVALFWVYFRIETRGLRSLLP